MTEYYMGIDLGSVSLNVVVADNQGQIKSALYRRTCGRPLSVLRDCLEELRSRFDAFGGVVATGSGRKMLGRILGVPDINEIVTQAQAACHFHPNVRTIVEIGGQDSKLIFVDRSQGTGEPIVVDHVLNDVCAAGTGSFLDLQAHRLGVTIEELGAMALQARYPARISGRCSVFAKSDMVHLIQEGTPKADIVAGLCNALVLNFITNLGKGRPFSEPVVFQGGVAANPGVVRAFESRLGLDPGRLIIPEHFLVMGAFGACLLAQNGEATSSSIALVRMVDRVEAALQQEKGRRQNHCLRPLVAPTQALDTTDRYYGLWEGKDRDVFLGIDIGAVSTNLVLIDAQRQVVAKQYWYTEGAMVDTVRAGLKEMSREMGDRVRVCGVGVTGSGRYFIGDFVGADVVINEISAQARASVHFDPTVDTIIEIGGQDSKFIRCKAGRIQDFEMNKVCAAGTGSFIEEQAARLNIPVRNTFSALAFSSKDPADLGARCTVFMESDLIHYQQSGQPLNDITAGLAYAIAQNYLEKLVGTRKIGDRVLFQGGVAGNQSVVSAFQNLLGKPVTVPGHHNVTGALGAALIARDRRGEYTRFAGFELKDRPYEVKTFECDKCPNLCRVHRVLVEGKQQSCHGGLCGRYEKSFQAPDDREEANLFEERERCLLGNTGNETEACAGITIGMPRAMSFWDRFPFWQTFFRSLGHHVILSEKTHKGLLDKGAPRVISETCFPVKGVYGHVSQLVEKGVDRIFLPCEIDHEQPDADHARSFNCPYVQSLPYMVKASFGSQIDLIAPIIQWTQSPRETNRILGAVGKDLGNSAEQTALAAKAAWRAQQRFDRWRQKRGEEFVRCLGPNDRVLVLLGKTHNIYDPGLNLHLAGKLRRQREKVLPFDLLPSREVALPSKYDNVVWKNTRDLLKALFWMKSDPRFFPILLTNFGCGPDSFLIKYMESELGDHPCLILEVDDHTGDAGMVTRIEAFLDTLEAHKEKCFSPAPDAHLFAHLIIKAKKRSLDPWGPDPRIMKKLERRTLYFPFVSRAFCSVVQAAFQSIGVDAQVLTEPDETSAHLGRQVTSGRECHPFIVTCGEFVKLTRRTDFDPTRTALLMQNYDGACRFSQYGIGHADLMQRLGFPEVPVIAPLTSPRFDEFSGLFGLRFTKRLWEGWLAAEVLERIRLHVRPYEKARGMTDEVYADSIEEVAKTVGRNGGKESVWSRETLEALGKGGQRLRAIPVDRTQQRPTVGIVGEFYTVLNRWANRDLVRTLEDLGAEVRLHGLTVPNFYTFFSEHYYVRNRLKEGNLLSAVYYTLRNQWMMSWVRRAEANLPAPLRNWATIPAKEIVKNNDPFIYYDIDPVLATFTARVRRFAASDIGGICNLYVLNCMLGNIAVAVFKNALKEYPRLPVFHASYDGQAGTNMLTRVEAFMHQVKLYSDRR